MDDRAEAEKKEIEAQNAREAAEILACLLDVRRRTGWGNVVIVLKGGEIAEIAVTYSRNLKTEKRNA